MTTTRERERKRDFTNDREGERSKDRLGGKRENKKSKRENAMATNKSHFAVDAWSIYSFKKKGSTTERVHDWLIFYCPHNVSTWQTNIHRTTNLNQLQQQQHTRTSLIWLTFFCMIFFLCWRLRSDFCVDRKECLQKRQKVWWRKRGVWHEGMGEGGGGVSKREKSE